LVCAAMRLVTAHQSVRRRELERVVRNSAITITPIVASRHTIGG